MEIVSRAKLPRASAPVTETNKLSKYRANSYYNSVYCEKVPKKLSVSTNIILGVV